MVSLSQISESSTLRRIRQIQIITIVWMSCETGISLFAAWLASSPALLAFGGDSAVELFSAAMVLWRFRTRIAARSAEKIASRVAGGLLFLVAAYVVVVSVMSMRGHNGARPSPGAIVFLIVTAVGMRWLAREKRTLSAETGSAALRADAAQSGLCAYLSLVALIGLAVNAVWHISWADPAAALAITPLIVWEGKEAIRGKACGCC
jgi:divalent metal cation (Fe/Co/Zn/Cd) transporter